MGCIVSVRFGQLILLVCAARPMPGVLIREKGRESVAKLSERRRRGHDGARAHSSWTSPTAGGDEQAAASWSIPAIRDLIFADHGRSRLGGGGALLASPSHRAARVLRAPSGLDLAYTSARQEPVQHLIATTKLPPPLLPHLDWRQALFPVRSRKDTARYLDPAIPPASAAEYLQRPAAERH